MAYAYRGKSEWLRRPSGDGLTFGCAEIPGPFRPLRVIFSDGMGWEHVSVSTPNRCPNWDEMCLVKSLFWADEDAVMQLHPPRSEYVNNHAHCLHLWRPNDGAVIPLPPSILVGVKGVELEPV